MADLTEHKVAVRLNVSSEVLQEAEEWRRIMAAAQEDMALTARGFPRLGPPEPIAVWEVPDHPPEGLSADAVPLWRALADLAGGTVVECDPLDDEDCGFAEAAAVIGSRSWRPGNYRRL